MMPKMPSREPNTPLKCAGCSANMAFDPASGGLRCPYCGATAVVPESGLDSVREHPYESRLDTTALRKVSEAAIQVTCSGCGATVQFEPPTTAGTCSFCAAPIVAQPKAADPLLAPDGLLPFGMTKDQAVSNTRTWLSALWFAPNALKAMARPEGVHGVYVPFWTFDAETYTNFSGERGDSYMEERIIDNKVQQVQVTRWSPAGGDVQLTFDDILVPASKSISPGRLAKLEPWDLEKVKPYEPAFLAGFQAQRYQLEVDGGLEASKRTMQAAIESAIRSQIGGNEQRIHRADTAYSGMTFKHLLLPVWIGAYRFQGRVFQIAVNARTGEVQGERPYSWAKIALLVAAIAIMLLLVFRNR